MHKVVLCYLCIGYELASANIHLIASDTRPHALVCMDIFIYTTVSYIAEFIQCIARILTDDPCQWQSPDSSFPFSQSVGRLCVGWHSCRSP